VLHPSQTVHVLTKNGATVLCISNDCSAWVEQGWMENEHTLDFTGRPPCAEEEAVVEVEAVPIPAVIVVNGVRVSTQPIPFSYGDLRKDLPGMQGPSGLHPAMPAIPASDLHPAGPSSGVPMLEED